MTRRDAQIDKYLQRYAEYEARALLDADITGRWKHVLVIPAYGESPELLKNLPGGPDTLLVLLLNRPDSDTNTGCNNELRQHAMRLPRIADIAAANANLLALPDGKHLLLMERPGPLPHREGVGLARKIGCDSALALAAMDCIESRWIHCSDADATLPEDYFRCAERAVSAVALSYPYRHTRPRDPRECQAMEVYERYLQHYVDGLQSAGSPYAFHTLGSCIAVDATAYAKVRGFARRAGGEDFYLLNKLAKLGLIATPDCSPIRLSARLSRRVPFGTGPALLKLLQEQHPEQTAMFYHPRCFEGLRELITCMEQHGRPGMSMDGLISSLEHAPESAAAAQELRIDKFLVHVNSQCANPAAFRRQFHQWFDGFRTLKFIHALSKHWKTLTIEALEQLDASAQPIIGCVASEEAKL